MIVAVYHSLANSAGILLLDPNDAFIVCFSSLHFGFRALQLPLNIAKIDLKIPRINSSHQLVSGHRIAHIDGALDQGAGHPERQINFLGGFGLSGEPTLGEFGRIANLNCPHHSSDIFRRDFFLASEKNQSR